MGMFDSIEVQFPLPDPEMQNSVFQTKDLACQLFLYTITVEGRLTGRIFEREWYPDPEGPLGIGGFKVVNERIVDLNYHGDLVFYDWSPGSSGVWPDMGDLWYYKAHFTDGVCQWIKRIEEE